MTLLAEKKEQRHTVTTTTTTTTTRHGLLAGRLRPLRVSVNPEDNTLITHLYNVTVRQPTILARFIHQFKGKL